MALSRFLRDLATLGCLALVCLSKNGSAQARVRDSPRADLADSRGPVDLVAPSVSISLGEPMQLFHFGRPDALGMAAVPDMHTAVMQQPDQSYRVWIAGRFGDDTFEGATGLITTRDFLTYAPVGSPTTAQVVLGPSCPGHPGPSTCWSNFDADYAGADLVFPAANSKDLLMLYHAATRTFGAGPPNQQEPAWCVMGLARSTDNGVTWTRQGPVVSGSDPKPDMSPSTGIFGVVEPGAIVARGFIYAFYAYFPTVGGHGGPPTIQVARAPVATDGAPGTWTKYFNGSFDSQPGLGGLGSDVVATVSTCTRPAQPWPVFSTYLNAYVLIFLCEEGWFFSTSEDLVTWSVPARFFTAPTPEFTNGQETDENVTLVTPGNPSQVIGQTGYLLYASTPSWGSKPHELWMRPFTFVKTRLPHAVPFR